MIILVTGASGMVGKNLCPLLIKQGHQVLQPTRQELNLANEEQTKKFLLAACPDLIIHLAAKVGGIQTNLSSPASFLFENLSINQHIITSAIQANIKKLINVASACVYPTDKALLHETDLMTGRLEPARESYGLAKLTSIYACKYANQEHKTNYKTVIPCNLYGPFDRFSVNSSHFIPAIIHKTHQAKISNNKTITIWGDGEAKRELMYVADLVDFLLFAIENFDRVPAITNVGTGGDLTINEYYEKIAAIVGVEPKFKFDLSKPVGTKKRLLDISSCKQLGWQSKTKLTDGLELTYDYYLNHVLENKE